MKFRSAWSSHHRNSGKEGTSRRSKRNRDEESQESTGDGTVSKHTNAASLKRIVDYIAEDRPETARRIAWT
jgi:hypothetical protein